MKSNNSRIRRIGIILLKTAGWITGIIVLLLVLVALLIQIPAIQQGLIQKAVTFVKDKVGTDVSVQKISIRFPKKVVLEGVYLEDQSRDTLLYAGKLSVDTDLFALVRNRIQLNAVELQDFTSNIHRSADSVFNFDYIIEAFAGDTTAQPDTTQSSWDFALHDIDLHDINLSYQDSLEGNSIALELGNLAIRIDEFDLNHSLIDIDNITLSDIDASVIQTNLPLIDSLSTSREKEDTAAVPMDIRIGEVDLRNIKAGYEQQAIGQQITLVVGRSTLKADEINLPARRIMLDEFLLEESFFTYHKLPSDYEPPAQEADTTGSETGESWEFVLNDLYLGNNSFQYYDFNEEVLTGAIDFSHLWITNFTTAVEGIVFRENEIAATLNEFSFAEKSGFAIRSMRGAVLVTENSADLRDFFLETVHSQLNVSLHGEFSSIEELSDSYGRAVVEATIEPSYVAWRDVLYFQPALGKTIPLTIPQNAAINFNTTISGSLDDLYIRHVKLAAFDGTAMAAHGRVRKVSNPDQMWFNVQLDTLHTTNGDLRTILPDTLLPPTMQLPQWIGVGGNFYGTMEKPTVLTALASDVGNIRLEAHLNLDSLSENQGYDGSLAVGRLQLGKILGQPETMGALTMEAQVKGTGTSIDNLMANFKSTVHSFVYQGYSYEDFKIEGIIEKYLFSGQASMSDPNLDFRLSADADYNKDIPAYNLTLDIRNADLHKLKLSQRPMQVRGTLKADFDNIDIHNLNGSIDMRDVLIYSGKLYRVDSLLFASINQEGNTEVNLQSDMVEGKFKGTIDIPSLPKVIEQHFRSYYTIHDTVQDKTTQSQNFEFNLQLKNTDLLTEVLMPELKSFVPGEIKGSFDSEDRTMDISVRIEKIHYTSVLAHELDFSLTSDDQRLEYGFTTGSIDAGSIHIPALEIDGEVEQDVINTSLVVRDSLEEEKYVLGGMFRSTQDGYRFYFDPDQVLLNYTRWQVPQGNYLQFGKGAIHANQLSLSNGEQLIRIVTPGDKDSTVAISFRKLDLKSLTNMVSTSDTLLSGLLHGDIRLFTARETGALEASIGISDLAIREAHWGDLSLTVNQTSSAGYALDLKIEGPGNALYVTGGYEPTETDAALNIQVDISSFNMAAFEPLSFGQLRDVKGTVSGDMSLKGSVDDPEIRGDIRFRNAGFFSTYLSTTLALHDEVISFDREGIDFNDFEIFDAMNNSLGVAGSIRTDNYRKYTFDLTVRASDFQLLNTTAEDNELFYGNVRLNTFTTIKGTSDLPVVNMRVSLGNESEFTYVVPQPESGVMEHEGIVKFVDRDVHKDPFLASLQKEGVVTDTALSFTGIDLTANIELNDDETFHIVMDPMTGDQLSVRGNAALVLNMDPTGDMQLSGRYELTEGSYNLTFYKLVKRELAIGEGSTIIWTGDPMDAMLDIRAAYRVETAPLDLVTNQLGSDQALINRYKQRLPFIVNLFIKGKILAPDISFELDMPELERGALEGVPYARIKDINTRESELNKQVFALLILQRFISDNPFENQAAEGIEGSARRSVSKILSDQLNKLSQNIEGVELNFDLKSYEDYSGGEAETTTQLQLGLTKNFLDERLVVKLSGNVNLEGGQTEQNNVTDFIGDLALEYKLTEDGRFRITGFRRSDYSMIDGQLIETGVGLIYVKDYNAFSELFRANVIKE